MGNVLSLPGDLKDTVIWLNGEAARAMGANNAWTEAGDRARDRLARPVDRQGGSTWGAGVRELVAEFQAGVVAPISENIQNMVTGQASGKYQFQPEVAENAKATRELTVATNRNTASLDRVAAGDDIRTGAGIANWLSSAMPGYGQAKEVTLLEKIAKGEAAGADLALLEELCEVVQATSLCGLGQTAPNPVVSTLRYFREEYEEKLQQDDFRRNERLATLSEEVK